MVEEGYTIFLNYDPSSLRILSLRGTKRATPCGRTDALGRGNLVFQSLDCFAVARNDKKIMLSFFHGYEKNCEKKSATTFTRAESRFCAFGFFGAWRACAWFSIVRREYLTPA